ncbi:MAG: DUF1592 domain-containing protein [Planctomycetes bacterium]|nr:DUF1592 domain-containing protein [Planctomycetota bacterium]
MPRYALLLLVLVGGAIAPLPSAFSQNSAVAAKKAEAFRQSVAPLIAKYCNQCHGGKRPKGELSLEQFKSDDDARKQPGVWDKVAQNLRSGDMPPAGKPRPTSQEQQIITSWIDKHVAQVDCTKARNPGRVTIRRLNRVEYKNTIRDLVGIEFKPAEDFPADDVGYGFDNIGDVLTLSPLLMERYLEAAERIVEQAIKTPAFRERYLSALQKEKSRGTAAKVIEGFARRAYRRPATPDEVERLTGFIRLARQNGQEPIVGLKLAFKAILVSPHFLFRVEVDRSATDRPDAVFAINEFELASRLSYFLWSSMPDDALLKAAQEITLRRDLVKQVERMMRDPKASAFTVNFAGQWLQLRNLRDLTPDPKLFPAYTPALREAMRRESELFFDTIVKEDRSILGFLDADFTFVNETLAKHYGIAGVKGPEFQRVKLDGAQRGGVLTQASILTLTSNPTRTSPVKRGKWILENLLGTPPPPPPPDAGELPEDKKQLTGSLRQRMEQHRSKAICASCHQRMDPLGFALENYDGIGAWRTKDGKFDIDPAGSLPSGQAFNGPRELRIVLKGKADEFRRCFTEKLLTYALGRGLEAYDKCTVDELCQVLVRNNDRLSTLIQGIVKSEPFQLRKGKGKT